MNRVLYHATDSANLEGILRLGLCVPAIIGDNCDRNDPACDRNAIYVTTDFERATEFARMATRDERDPGVVFEILESDLPPGTYIESDDYVGGSEVDSFRIKGTTCIAPHRYTFIRGESPDSGYRVWKRYHDQGEVFSPRRHPSKPSSVSVRSHVRRFR